MSFQTSNFIIKETFLHSTFLAGILNLEELLTRGARKDSLPLWPNLINRDGLGSCTKYAWLFPPNCTIWRIIIPCPEHSEYKVEIGQECYTDWVHFPWKLTSGMGSTKPRPRVFTLLLIPIKGFYTTGAHLLDQLHMCKSRMCINICTYLMHINHVCLIFTHSQFCILPRWHVSWQTVHSAPCHTHMQVLIIFPEEVTVRNLCLQWKHLAPSHQALMFKAIISFPRPDQNREVGPLCSLQNIDKGKWQS